MSDFILQRSLTEQQRESLTNEYNGLNLSRYIQEAVCILALHYITGSNMYISIFIQNAIIVGI
jgi:hypothetical protein